MILKRLFNQGRRSFLAKILIASLAHFFFPVQKNRVKASEDSSVIRVETSEFGLQYSPRVSSSPSKTEKPPVLFVHGGGLLLGSPETRRFDLLARRIASEGHAVFSVRYSKLWQGLDRTQGARNFHCAAKTLSPSAPIRVVAISAGSWLALRSLQEPLLPSSDPCAQHGPVTHFAAISPMIQPLDAVGPRWIARWFERSWDLPRISRANFPASLFILHGREDWLVPEPTSRGICSEAVQDSSCQRHTVPRGHFIVRDGLAGTEETTQALLQFLASSSN